MRKGRLLPLLGALSMTGSLIGLSAVGQTFQPSDDQMACARAADAQGKNTQVYVDCMIAHGHREYHSTPQVATRPAPAPSYNPALTPYQNYKNAQTLLVPKPAPAPPPPTDDGTHRVDNALTEVQRESSAWVSADLVPGSFKDITVQPSQYGPTKSVSVHFSTSKLPGQLAIVSTNSDGSVGAVCYQIATTDDPLEVFISGSYRHVIPSREKGRRLAPCYAPKEIGDTEFKRAARLRTEKVAADAREQKEFVRQFKDRIASYKPSSEKQRPSCSLGQALTASRNGMIGGMWGANGCP